MIFKKCRAEKHFGLNLRGGGVIDRTLWLLIIFIIIIYKPLRLLVSLVILMIIINPTHVLSLTLVSVRYDDSKKP